ncbi:MAG: hypothetical protein ACYC64_13015 [Armatimonadota bacterium]
MTCAILAVLSLPCAAAIRNHPSQMLVIVVANRLTLDDLDNSSLRSITRMINDGAAGLISPNCAGSKSELSCMVTAGAGASCRGGAFLGEVYDAREQIEGGVPARDSYTRRTGFAASPKSAVFVNLGPALRANTELAKPARLGALGDALHEAGKKTCAIGNSDIHPDKINRAAAVLAMDSHGLIDIGQLEAGAPKLSIPTQADFVVIDYGATTRLDDSKNSMTDNAFAMHKAEVMRGLDRLLAGLLRDKNLSVILVSFGLPVGDPWDRLTPIVIYGPVASGVLTSPTTRTPGLVAASDFAPTVLDMFGIPAPPDMIGRAVRTLPLDDKIGVLRNLETRVQTHQAVVEPVIYVIMSIGGVTFISAMVVLGFSRRAQRKMSALIRVGLVTGCASSLAMLLAVLAPTGVVSHLIGLTVLWVLTVVVSFALGSVWKIRAAPMVVMFALGAAAIILDAVTGGKLCRFAIPSQFQLSGFRYYGIGNEYAGILISMSALVSIFSGEKLRRWLTPILGVIVIVVLGMGCMGANYGGTIAAAVTFGLVLLGMKRGRFGMRHVVAIFGCAVAIVALLAVIDYRAAGSTAAHAGRMASLVQRIGGDYVLSLIARKVMLNLHVATHPEAVLAYFVLIPIGLFWIYRIPAKLKDEIFRDRHVAASLKGLLIGMVAALVLNDSGIVMALLMFGMMSSLLIYSLIEVAQCQE